MNRGARKQPIFLDSSDKFQFLTVMGEASDTYDLEIHAYCLMSNHYHLLIKTPMANLSKGMKHINGTYTQRYNLTHRFDGSLFRGRYKAIIVDSNEYLLQVSRYIHLNPVSASITAKPEQYFWSSYQDYISSFSRHPWLYKNDLLSQFNHDPAAYRRFVESGLDNETKDFFSQDIIPAIFGSESFKEKLLLSLPQDTVNKSKPDYNRSRDFPSLHETNQICANFFALNEDDLTCKRRKNNIARKIAVYIAKICCKETTATIASFYQCTSASSVSKITNEVRGLLTSQPEIEEQIHRLLNRIMNDKCKFST